MRATAEQGRRSEFHVVAIDYGLKRNILRCLASNAGLPSDRCAGDDVRRRRCSGTFSPDGIFLSNGPGDPAATGVYAVPEIRKLARQRQADVRHLPRVIRLLGPRAWCRKLRKMHQGHHGANHPVKDHTTGKVEITSMNHGFAVDRNSLPDACRGNPYFAVRRLVIVVCGWQAGQCFPSSITRKRRPGPQDSHYLFGRFVDEMRTAKAART